MPGNLVRNAGTRTTSGAPRLAPTNQVRAPSHEPLKRIDLLNEINSSFFSSQISWVHFFLIMSQLTNSTGWETEVVYGDVECKGRVVLYIVKGMSFFCFELRFVISYLINKMKITANETNYINYIKPLILARELQCPHVISCIDTRDEWFYSVHPERTVPSLKDQDPETGENSTVFEGTACLQYLASRFDKDGLWTGKTDAEKGKVMSWTAYQTAGLGYIIYSRLKEQVQC